MLANPQLFYFATPFTDGNLLLLHGRAGLPYTLAFHLVVCVVVIAVLDGVSTFFEEICVGVAAVRCVHRVAHNKCYRCRGARFVEAALALVLVGAQVQKLLLDEGPHLLESLHGPLTDEHVLREENVEVFGEELRAPRTAVPVENGVEAAAHLVAPVELLAFLSNHLVEIVYLYCHVFLVILATAGCAHSGYDRKVGLHFLPFVAVPSVATEAIVGSSRC